MKDSGIEWVGKIDSRVQMTPVKYLLEAGKGAIKVGPFGSQLSGTDFQNEETDYWVYNQRSVIDRNAHEGTAFISEEKYKSMKGFHVKPGDILITTRGTIGKVFRLPEEVNKGILHPCIIRFRLNNNAYDYELLEMIFNESDMISRQLLYESNSTTIEVIYSETLRNIKIPVWSMEMQRCLSIFLKEKCAEIDALIADIKAEIETLEAYKRSVITEAVTKGLDKTAPMKDSGIKWIGAMPEHWDLTRGKYCLKQLQKQSNVSMFAFTATPKDKTLRLFGQLNKHGQYEAFHLYSMKQAIEEGYILDVLQNFTEYDTLFKLNKEIEDDPEMKTDDAKRQIARFIELHETNIAQRVEVIVEHFRNVVMNELGGMAKAMVVTASRPAAVKYQKAFKDYIARKGYKGIDALVAFSGKVKLDDDDTEYTEPGMNGMREEQTPIAFDSEEYNVLIVADKYQTGFDQKKLCAMYVLKKLKGVNAVQTYSRLNRICPPFDKKTFILDFINTYDDVQKSFAPFYTTTLLSGNINVKHIYDLEANLDAFLVLDPLDIQNFNDLLFKKRANAVTSAEEKAMTFYLQKSEKLVKQYDALKQREIRMQMRGFVRFYEFLLQASCFKDVDLHKKYTFITYLLSYLDISGGGSGFDLKGKIRADQFVQREGETHKGEKLVSKPVVKLPTSDGFNLTEAKKERLSQIIDEINSRTGKAFDSDVAVKAMLQIKDLLLKSDKLKKSAKNNSEADFEFSFYDDIDDALIEGLEQNQDFFSLLLNNEELKKSVLGIFASEIYKSLRNT